MPQNLYLLVPQPAYTFLIHVIHRTSNSTIAVVLGGCIGEATAPFLVSLAIARFGPEAFIVCIGTLIVALVINYISLHVYLKVTSTVSGHDYEDVQDCEGSNNDISRQCSPVLQRRRYPSNPLLQNNNGRFADSSAEKCYYTTESPKTLMNYTGVSSARTYTAFSEDGNSEGEHDPSGPKETELTPLVLPSTRYHAVRCVNGFAANSTNATIGTSGFQSRSRSPYRGICEGDGAHSIQSPYKSTTVSPDKNTSIFYTPGSHTGNSGHDTGSSLYARSFRRPVPLLRHPLHNKQYEQLLQEEDDNL